MGTLNRGPGSRRPRAAHRSVVLVAPAKLTTSLRVVGRRPDGYHELEAEMVSLDLADLIEVDPGGDGLEVLVAPGAAIPAPGAATTPVAATTTGQEGPGSPSSAAHLVLPDAGPDNLVVRALAAAGRRAHVRLHKRIPVGGGLGGGSSDAAAILRWADCRDVDVAAALGADVPFCVEGGRAIVRGIGERVSALDYRPQAFVLLLPPFGVDTGAVYREWDRMAERGDTIRDILFNGPVNDLTAPALTVEPRLARWRDALGDITGAPPVLAGSGSTWWVEGTPATLGLEGRTSLRLEGEEGRLLPVHAVPSGWTGERAPEG